MIGSEKQIDNKTFSQQKIKTDDRSISRFFDLTTIAPLAFLILLLVIYSIFARNFLSSTNFLNILRQVSITGIMAVGVMMVIMLGEIDLSIATVMAFSGMIVSGLSLGKYFGLDPLPVGVCIAIAIVIGLVIGFISGCANAFLHIPGFMATLSMMFICDGLMLMLTGAAPIFGLPRVLTYWGSGYILGGVPVIIVIFLAVFLLGMVMLKYTVYGRNLYAIGGNSEASRLAGIKVDKNKILTFMFCSGCAALAGILMVGRIGSGQVTSGEGLQMQPIAAAVLGGASLRGGKGTMIGTALGVLIMGVLVNGLNIMGAGSEIQKLVTGLVVFSAVTFNVWTARKY